MSGVYKHRCGTEMFKINKDIQIFSNYKIMAFISFFPLFIIFSYVFLGGYKTDLRNLQEIIFIIFEKNAHSYERLKVLWLVLIKSFIASIFVLILPFIIKFLYNILFKCRNGYIFYLLCSAIVFSALLLYYFYNNDKIYLPNYGEYKGPSVSFCSTYRDRFGQISQTLPKNLEDNRKDKDFVDFIIIDFDPSDDTLKKFIFENFAEDVKSGYIKYYQTDKMPKWDFSLAKNTAHYYADNEVVVNLDVDNYTGYRGGAQVANILKDDDNSFLWQNDKGSYVGNFGRIAFYRKQFDYLGGYDENLPAPATNQDLDIVQRAEAVKYKKITLGILNEFISNTKSLTIKHTDSKLSIDDMDKLNKAYMKDKMNKGEYIANKGVYGIRTGVYRIMSMSDKAE